QIAAAAGLVLVLTIFLSARPLAAQAPATDPAAAAPAPPSENEVWRSMPAKPVDKVYIVGYTLLGLMIGLGLLVVCHTRSRQDRPDLPQEEVMERLRNMHGKPGQKA
ncbi:MAG: hypothetical protein K8T25_24525, partial [Planctomycetia bacterium]|nr:hypothetical protein [Planctomycetia bacterium]